MVSILEKIVTDQKTAVAEAKKITPFLILQEQAAKLPFRRSHFLNSLKEVKPLALIAEIKRASPSMGTINAGVDIVSQAKQYEAAGASAISVLTNKHFDAALADLALVRAATTLPILRKDFIIDEYQIYESVLAGADAILLIACILTTEEIKRFSDLAQKLGLDCLVEVHSSEDVQKISLLKLPLIGINQRNLETFVFDYQAFEHLRPFISSEAFVVAESGITSRRDVLALAATGAQGLLVGTTLMQAKNVSSKIKELMLRTKVKICGLTSLEDARIAARAGADYLGFIINVPRSPRSLTVTEAKAIVSVIKKEFPLVECVGVFVDEPRSEVQEAIEEIGFDVVQLHGNEPPGYCSALKQKCAVWKTILIKNAEDVSRINTYRPVADKLLFDAGQGSGKQFDHGLLAGQIVDVLAGGLTAENIQEAMVRLHPQIVDCNSGVETAPGKKDEQKIKAVIAVVKSNAII